MNGTFHGGPPPEWAFPHLDDAGRAIQEGYFYDVIHPLKVADGHVGQVRMTEYLLQPTQAMRDQQSPPNPSRCIHPNVVAGQEFNPTLEERNEATLRRTMKVRVRFVNTKKGKIKLSRKQVKRKLNQQAAACRLARNLAAAIDRERRAAGKSELSMAKLFQVIVTDKGGSRHFAMSTPTPACATTKAPPAARTRKLTSSGPKTRAPTPRSPSKPS